MLCSYVIDVGHPLLYIYPLLYPVYPLLNTSFIRYALLQSVV